MLARSLLRYGGHFSRVKGGITLAQRVRALFANGEEGAWFDSFDFSTLYQDSLGTTPVTAVEQPVGLMLDKKFGTGLGAELVSNGTFDTDTTGWGANGAVLSVVAGALRITGDGVTAYPSARRIIPTIIGASYEVSYRIRRVNAVQAQMYLRPNGYDTTTDQVAMVAVNQSAWLTQRAIYRATTTTMYVRPTVVSTATTDAIELDDFSVKRIGTGAMRNATQATAASRLVLSARVNVLQYSEDFSQTGTWQRLFAGTSAVAPIITPNYGTAPDGTQTACRVQSDRGTGTGAGDYSLLQQSVTGNSLPHSSRVWIKSNTGINQSIYHRINTDRLTTITPEWVEYELSDSSALVNAYMSVGSRASSQQVCDFLIWHPQVKVGVDSVRYQRVTTSTDYDTAGFPHADRFDGVDDSVATAGGGGATSAFFACLGIKSMSRGAALATPVNAAFSTATTGGTLAAGTYYYRVSAINSMGETLASTETSIATTGSTSTVTVNWGAVSGATGYKVYGRSTGAELLMATVGNVTTWTDDGSITPAGALPAANTTAYMTLMSDGGTNTGFIVRLDYEGKLVLMAGNGTTHARATTAAGIALGQAAVLTAWHDGANLKAQINSGAIASAPFATASAGTAAITLGKDNGAASGFLNGQLYSTIYVKDDVQSDAQIDQAKRYTASKTQVVL